MSSSCHSEYTPLQSVCIFPATDAFKDQNKLAQDWAALNYLSQPEYGRALSEYSKFRRLLEDTVPNVFNFPNSHNTSIDAIYCRDASIATDHGMILCNMGKAGRSTEPRMQEAFYKKMHIPILGAIEAPGILEGGDVAWLNTSTLAVGQSYRTNIEGIQQLEHLLLPLGVKLLIVDLPHYKGSSDVFHLMSILSPIDKDLAVVYSPLMPIRFRKQLISMGYELIEVPHQEFESMGCNVLAVAARKCIMLNGNPVTEASLIKAGCEVFTYEGLEISVKGGGGPTCLTRPIQRLP